MRIIEPSIDIISFPEKALEMIELGARVCYQSEPKTSPEKFVKGLLDRGHMTPFEHVSATVRIICDRGVSHELVRHRIASFNQESTRYANYSKEKFGNEITVIKPYFWSEYNIHYNRWLYAMEECEVAYMDMLGAGCTPQEARSVLPNSLKTEIIITANFREWFHIFKLRCHQASHPQMVQIMTMVRDEFAELLPVLFGGTS